MKKLLIIAGALVFFVVYWAGLFLIGLPRAAAPPQLEISATPEIVARGDYLFNNVLGCQVCHSERNYELFGAPAVPPFGAGRACAGRGEHPPGLADAGGMPGTLCMRNITSDKRTGVGDWTDGEILRMMREGIHRTGRGMFPMMPYFIYRNLSDMDAQSVVAYLRTLPPVENELPETEIDFPLSLFVKLVPEPLDGPVKHPDENDPVAYGEYLAKVARCEFCHTPRDRRTRQPLAEKEYTGGVVFQGRDGFLYSTNLTSHPDGLGKVSLAEFIALFKRPPVPVEGEVNIMPWTYYGGMTDADLGAIYTFLQTVPAQPFDVAGEE